MKRGIVAGFLGGLLIAGIVLFSLQVSIPQAVAIGLVSGVLGAAITGAASVLAVTLTLGAQARADQDRREREEAQRRRERLRFAYGQLIEAANSYLEAARELRMYPKGRPPPGNVAPTPDGFDPFQIVNESMATAKAAFRSAEREIVMETGPGDSLLLLYEDIRSKYHGWWVLLIGGPTPPDKMQEAWDEFEAAVERLKRDVAQHLRDVSSPMPELPPLDSAS